MPLDTRTIFTFLFVEQTPRKFSVSFQGATHYNSLGNDIKESNDLHSFKARLKKKNVNY